VTKWLTIFFTCSGRGGREEERRKTVSGGRLLLLLLLLLLLSALMTHLSIQRQALKAMRR